MFTLYIFFVFFITVNMFVGLVTEVYSTVKSELLASEEEAELKGMRVEMDMFNYIIDQIKAFLHLKEREEALENESLRFAYISGIYFSFFYLGFMLLMITY